MENKLYVKQTLQQQCVPDEMNHIGIRQTHNIEEISPDSNHDIEVTRPSWLPDETHRDQTRETQNTKENLV